MPQGKALDNSIINQSNTFSAQSGQRPPGQSTNSRIAQKVSQTAQLTAQVFQEQENMIKQKQMQVNLQSNLGRYFNITTGGQGHQRNATMLATSSNIPTSLMNDMLQTDHLSLNQPKVQLKGNGQRGQSTGQTIDTEVNYKKANKFEAQSMMLQSEGPKKTNNGRNPGIVRDNQSRGQSTVSQEKLMSNILDQQLDKMQMVKKQQMNQTGPQNGISKITGIASRKTSQQNNTQIILNQKQINNKITNPGHSRGKSTQIAQSYISNQQKNQGGTGSLDQNKLNINAYELHKLIAMQQIQLSQNFGGHNPSPLIDSSSFSNKPNFQDFNQPSQKGFNQSRDMPSQIQNKRNSSQQNKINNVTQSNILNKPQVTRVTSLTQTSNSLASAGTNSGVQTRIGNQQVNQSTRIFPNKVAHQNMQPSYPQIQSLQKSTQFHNENVKNRQSQKTVASNQRAVSHIEVQEDQDLVSESQILESEEYFEQAKIFLADRNYKEAEQLFTKSLIVNSTNYDALFYRAVTNLDSDLPNKAIQDLVELQNVCPDYRKTMFIVLSIAHRRVNDYQQAIQTLSKAIHLYPTFLEAYIARGQIYIFLKDWDLALQDFQTVIRYQPNNTLAYLGQADCLKGLGKKQDAIKSYSKVIDLDPLSTCQSLMKRGLLQLELKQNSKAFRDFNLLIEIAEVQHSILTGKPRIEKSVSIPPDQAPSPQSKPLNEDKEDFEKYGDYQNCLLSKAYFYKAKTLKKMNKFQDSILYFEQVLRLNEDNYLQGSSLYEIAKIKIFQKDFYEANYNLQRTVSLNLKQRKLINYKLFAEGVIFLMKRKTKTGVSLLTQVIERMSGSNGKENKNSDIKSDKNDFIYPLLYLYRAYGLMLLEEYKKSLSDYLQSSQLKKLNESQSYNMVLCNGLKNLDVQDYEQAIQYFTRSATQHPKKRDPYLLRAMSIVQHSQSKEIKACTKIQMLKDAKRDLNRALANSQKDETVLYLRGILNFALHRFYDAICDFERVIELSDDTNAMHYLARGRCYACLSMFKEAITDLSIAININKDLIDAYLNRGKCAYLIGDTGLAFMDFQKLIVLEPKNASVHISAGNLLMTTGSYEDATKAFTNADNIQKSPLALYQRSRCYVALNNMNEALKDLNKVIDISKNDKVAIQDRDCLNALLSCSILSLKANNSSQVLQKYNDCENQSSDLKSIPSQPDIESIIKQQPIERNNFQKALQALTKLISYEKNESLSRIVHESSILHKHSQMIPSAHRTKIDKIRAIKRRKEQDRTQRENPENGRKNDLRFRVNQEGGNGGSQDDGDEYEDISELDDEEIEKLNRKLVRNESDELRQESSQEEEEQNGEENNYYKENIFNKEDFYLYRAIFYTYSTHYSKAIADFEQCSSIMHHNKVLHPKNQFKDDDDGYSSPTGHGNVNGRLDHQELSQDEEGSSQTDLSDVGLCSLNIHEYSFNATLCLILSKDYQQAIIKLDYILSTITKKYANQLWLLRGALHTAIGQIQSAQSDFKRAYKYDKDNAFQFLEERKDVCLPIFPQQQRLCNFFQFIRVEIEGMVFPKKGGNQSIPAFYLKPSFSFPFIKPPNMIPCVDQPLVLQQFKMKNSTVQLKPEAPWIKKSQFGIRFTEEILYTDDEREPTPDEEKEYKKRKQRQQERAMEGAGFVRAHSEKVVLKNNIFLEDNPPQSQEQKNGKIKEDDGQLIYQDEDGNAINIAELAELHGLGDLADFCDLDESELDALDQKDAALAHQLRLLKHLQRKEQKESEEDDQLDVVIRN